MEINKYLQYYVILIIKFNLFNIIAVGEFNEVIFVYTIICVIKI